MKFLEVKAIPATLLSGRILFRHCTTVGREESSSWAQSIVLASIVLMDLGLSVTQHATMTKVSLSVVLHAIWAISLPDDRKHLGLLLVFIASCPHCSFGA